MRENYNGGLHALEKNDVRLNPTKIGIDHI
jgi:hypothetical protein